MYVSRLVGQTYLSQTTVAVYLKKPTGFQFRPGQFMGVAVANSSNAGPSVRMFTIASAPHEEHLMVVTRTLSSGFIQELGGIPVNAELFIDGPRGTLSFDPDPARPAVFLAGGVGIAPFRSIIIDTLHKRQHRNMFLFYCNRRPEDAPFLEELACVQKYLPGYKLIATMTQTDISAVPWLGATGRINQQILQKYLGQLAKPNYYVVGPPRMVNGLRLMLERAGVSAKDIWTEA